MDKIINTNSILLFGELTNGIINDMKVSLPLNMRLIKDLYNDKGILINKNELLITIDFGDDITNDCIYYLDHLCNGQVEHLRFLELKDSDKCFLNKLALQTLSINSVIWKEGSNDI